jgi:hypothetical protein
MELEIVDPSEIPKSRGRALKDQPAVTSFVDSSALATRVRLTEEDKDAESVGNSLRNFCRAKNLDVVVRVIVENGEKVIYMVKEEGQGQKYQAQKDQAAASAAKRQAEKAAAEARGEELPPAKRGRKAKAVDTAA